jgi:hypothetical protein
MARVRFELLMVAVFEQSRTLHAIDHTVAVIGHVVVLKLWGVPMS